MLGLITAYLTIPVLVYVLFAVVALLLLSQVLLYRRISRLENLKILKDFVKNAKTKKR